MRIGTLVLLAAVLVAPVAGQGSTESTDCIAPNLVQDVRPAPDNPEYLLVWTFSFTNRCAESVSVMWYGRYPASDRDDWGASGQTGRHPIEPGETYQPPWHDNGFWPISRGGPNVPRPLLAWCGWKRGERRACILENDFFKPTARGWRKTEW